MLARMLAIFVVCQAAFSVLAESSMVGDFAKQEPFSLICSVMPSFTSSASRPSTSDLRVWTMYANLKHDPYFELAYDGRGHRLVVSLVSREELQYKLTGVNKEPIDSRQLATFDPTGLQGNDLGSLYVRFPTSMIDDWTENFVRVEHGRPSNDRLGGRGFYKAIYVCATPEQIESFETTQNAPCRAVFKGIYDCNE